MARNLRAKLPKDDTLIVHDCRPETALNFVQEGGYGAHTRTADTPHGVAAEAVRDIFLFKQGHLHAIILRS